MPSTPTPAAPGDVLGAFPASMPGHQRHVVKLPPLENEHLHRVELLGGKTLKVYWVFSSKGQVMSTRMGCPPGGDRQQFVSAETLLVPYNSRIPLVVFVPEGFEFRSRPFDTRAAGLPAPAR